MCPRGTGLREQKDRQAGDILTGKVGRDTDKDRWTCKKQTQANRSIGTVDVPGYTRTVGH